MKQFSKVIIHLGDFHGFQLFFGNIGKFVTDSGFEDIIYQADLCSDGGLNSIIHGKSYNKCWLIHECMSEAIDRLFHEMLSCTAILDQISSNSLSFLQADAFATYKKKYTDLKERCMNGEMGSTAKYWAIYHHMVQLVHQLHYAININYYDLRRVWDEMLQLSFVMSKQNYAKINPRETFCTDEFAKVMTELVEKC